MEKKEFESLSDNELSQVSGGDDTKYMKGCKKCKGETQRSFLLNGIRYYMWRCDKCGKEYYIKGSAEIAPSEWYAAQGQFWELHP